MNHPSKKDGTEKTYKIHVRPCYPYEGFDGKGEIMEITTSDIRWSMRQIQRNRVPFLYEIKSVKDPK